jgi:D-alanine-D-alanine ligase-like ATP-grasp enzyme
MSKPKHPCIYCGNNPVPHPFYYFSESLNIFLTPLRQALMYNPVARFIKRGRFLDFFEKLFLALAEKLRIITRQPDAKLCKVRRAQVLWDEAEQRGIVMNELLLFGKPIDTYIADKSEIRNPKSEIVFNGLPRPAGYVNKWLDLMDDKWLFKKIMMKNGLPVPIGASCSNFRQARLIFKEIQKSEIRNPQSANLDFKLPVIVKPRAGSRGRHSTTFVRSEADLKRAFKVAKQLCHWVMVEEQLFGPVYRATIIDGHLAGVLRGDPPFVTGDGQSNIADLIKQKNQTPHPGVKDITVDSNCEMFLARQNLALSSVLPKGQTINLTEKIGINYGGSSSEDYDICHPDNKELFIKAAKILGDPIVGFDFIIPDINISWKNQKCGFIEVNSLPFINLHHDPLLGAPRNAAALVWDMLGW